MEAAVRSCQPFDEVLHTRAGCTVSSHCGPPARWASSISTPNNFSYHQRPPETLRFPVGFFRKSCPEIFRKTTVAALAFPTSLVV